MAQQQTVTLPWNQASITALASAMAQGVLEVTHEGRTVRYASRADMADMLDRMTRYVTNQGDGISPPHTRASVFVRR